MKFRIISLDIFQTLADVNKRIPDIWRGILKEGYTDEKAAEGAGAVLRALPATLEHAAQSEPFETMEELYLECAAKAAESLPFRVSPGDVAHHLMFQHSKAPFYPEVPECLKELLRSRQIVLSSDSSRLMVDGLIEKLTYSRAFISDDLKCYKGGENGRFFKTVLSSLHAAPDEILHIGDSVADILGARRAGIASCWINRNGRKWSASVQPDFIIRDLNGLFEIL